ncbi:PREDICTED: olfactory receptor 1020-like [Gekko japonicus]|uniref:Olfactory receptor n=1 Tax=Gekko japonicus TaxID=146911 RepID=A0ABM1KWT7_GEKJA|nr:PREDICTED: olfactory receptor 1020-like [Gekko japonicus]
MNNRGNVSYQVENQTVTTEFLLLGFGDLHHLQILLFLLFLLIYIVTVTGNLLIILLVVANQHLHTPMYFFIGNLSCLETCYSSTLLPRMLVSFVNGDRTISVSGCIAQFYFFGCLAGAECFLLSAMSYDRYSAICNPLHYPNIMNSKICFILASSSWIGGFAVNTVIISFMSQLTFCGPNEIDHFFCDFAPLMEHSCSDTYLVTVVDLSFSTICALPPFLLTLASYICIIATILRIPSTSGRQKTFSTCSSHLIVVTSFFGTLILVYIVPSSPSAVDVKKILSVFYTVLTPLVNPLVYSFRNKEVNIAFRKFTSKHTHFQKK